MENNVLVFELLKRVFGNIGAVPGKNFGKVGITLDDYLIDKTIKLKNIDDDKIEEYPIWAGQLPIENGYKIILTNINTLDSPEFIAVIQSKNVLPIGFRLCYDDNSGSFVVSNDKFWVGMSVLYMLNITAALELITQEGIVWMPCSEHGELYDFLVSLLDV